MATVMGSKLTPLHFYGRFVCISFIYPLAHQQNNQRYKKHRVFAARD